jgi:hypothetical protein
MGHLDDQTSVIFSGMWSGIWRVLGPGVAIFLGATLGLGGAFVLSVSSSCHEKIAYDLFDLLLFLLLLGSIVSHWCSESHKCEIFCLIILLCWLHIFRYAVTPSNVPLSCLVAVVSLAIMAGLYVSLRFGPYWWFLLRQWYAENREQDTEEDEEDEDRFKTIDLTVEDPPPAPRKSEGDGPFPRIK